MVCKMCIIVLTFTRYAISYIKVLNDFCICTKRLYSIPHLYNATPYYSIITRNSSFEICSEN